MTLALCFYICMLLWLLLGLRSNWPNLGAGGHDLLLFIVILLLGWRTFGPPLQG